jgi:hypothetical protein
MMATAHEIIRLEKILVRTVDSSDPAISRHEAPNEDCRPSLSELNTPTRLIKLGINQIFILAREEPRDRLHYSCQASRPHATSWLQPPQAAHIAQPLTRPQAPPTPRLTWAPRSRQQQA